MAAAEEASGPDAAPAPGRAQLFDLVAETFLEKMEEAGSYERFSSCYRSLYKAQPGLTKGLHDRFTALLKDSFREEVQDLKQEGNLEAFFGKLDKLEQEAKDRETPAWRPSGIPEEDVRSAIVPYLLKQQEVLQKTLKKEEEESARLAESVLAGRKRIADLQEEIRRRKEAWQATAREAREFANSLEELQYDSASGKGDPSLSGDRH